MSSNIRPLTPQDQPFLWEMLYLAIYVPEGQAAPSREMIRRPELARYVEGWGRDGDCGFLATDAARRPVGAALFAPPFKHRWFPFAPLVRQRKSSKFN